MVGQPSEINIPLFPHQLASIFKMEKLENDNTIIKDDYIKKTKIGINSDITGFGKTLTMLGLIARDNMEWDLDVPYVYETVISEAKGRIKNYFTSRLDKLPTTLILVPSSIIGQWEKELNHTTLKYYIVKNKKDTENLRAEKYDVVVTTSIHYNDIVMMYSKFAWKRFIFDEPGHLKVAGMREIHAGFYWFVTATPDLIYSKQKFCKNNFMRDILSNMYDPDCFISDLIIKNDPEFVKASFEMPPTNYITHLCYQPLYNVVMNYVSSTVRTMIEAENIEGAIELLGGSKTSNIVELIKNKKLHEIQQIDLNISYSKVINDPIKENNWLLKRERVEKQIEELDLKYEEMLESDCVICAEKLKEPVLEPSCQKLFCGKCLLSWLSQKNSCPICRNTVELKNLIYINKDKAFTEEKKEYKEKKMTKIEKILSIIQSNKEGRFLVFSDYDNTFYPICNSLKENEIEYVQIRGTIKNREKNIDSFKGGKIPVIFLNSTTDGCGINLTEATDIILCHQMDKCTENQILGRALRIGRRVPLNVHYLQISKN